MQRSIAWTAPAIRMAKYVFCFAAEPGEIERARNVSFGSVSCEKSSACSFEIYPIIGRRFVKPDISKVNRLWNGSRLNLCWSTLGKALSQYFVGHPCRAHCY